MAMRDLGLGGPPDWYRDAVIYEVHVRAFADGTGDGTGDFRGLTKRLDHLQELGVTALWLLPFYPSPLRDDGYDIADYTSVHPSYGTLADVRRFLQEAHRRGLRVITELVLNHTSDQHPWFQRARRAKPGSAARDWYVWSDTDERYRNVRIIFRDYEPSNWTWDPVAGAHYWHRFYRHQPDLNFENPAVRRALLRVVDFWFALGVDGLRLDAVPYLFEAEGTTCENLPPTHAFLKELRAHVDARFPNRMLLAEANMWPEDAVAYFGDGDECHMAFHFPLMPRLFMGLRMEDRFPIVDILAQTPPIPDGCQWATFLRNHDELTLEMVSEEERDYMYRTYASDAQARINLGIRRRLAPLVQNDRRRIELLNVLLFSMPGTPVVYYGDEIGMGDNIHLGDRDSVRTPMQWSSDRNAGFSTANPQQLYLPVITDPEYHYQTVNVEAQRSNPSSLLRWMQQLVALRRRQTVLGRGNLQFRLPDDPRVLAFTRGDDGDQMLVVANLSRRARQVELDLADLRGATPVEMFGGAAFRPVDDRPYQLSLGPYGYYWFRMERPHAEVRTTGRDVPTVTLDARAGDRLRSAVAAHLAEQSLELIDLVPVPRNGSPIPSGLLALGCHEEPDGERVPVLVPLAVRGRRRHDLGVDHPLARIDTGAGAAAWLTPAEGSDRMFPALVAAAGRRRLPGDHGAVTFRPGPAAHLLRGRQPETSAPLGARQANVSAVVDGEIGVKLYRRPVPGVNPEVEVLTALAHRGTFRHVPEVVGSLDHERPGGETVTIGVLTRFVPAEADLRSLSADHFARALDEVATLDRAEATGSGHPLAELGDLAALVGRRVAELHVALAAVPGPAFAPEPFTAYDQRATYQSLRTGLRRVVAELRRRQRSLPEDLRPSLEAVVGGEAELLDRFAWLLRSGFGGQRIRNHGHLHLGQLLWTGRDVVIIDFEGEPDRPVGERRLKRSPLRDLSFLHRSLARSAHRALQAEIERGAVPDQPEMHRRLTAWTGARVAHWASIALDAYLATPEVARLLPDDRDAITTALHLFTLDRVVDDVARALAGADPGALHEPLQALAAARS